LATSQAVATIPTDGTAVCVRLWTQVAGVWQYNDYAYTAAAISSRAVLATPPPGTPLSGSNITFTWNAGGVGSYFGKNVGLATSQAVATIPTDGRAVCVRLWTQVAGVWQYNDYAYTAAAITSKAVLATPPPGTPLSGSNITFIWNAGAGASAYWLDVGPSPGVGSYFGKNVGVATSQVVTAVPTDGRAVCVRLWTQVAGVWQYNDYSYTAAPAHFGQELHADYKPPRFRIGRQRRPAGAMALAAP
jgi:hypothetical protein